MRSNTLGELIQGRLIAMGGMSRTDLRKAMERIGSSVHRQQIHAWVNDTARPGKAHLIALMDVLLIAEADRRAWLEAAAVSATKPLLGDLPAPVTE